MKIFVSKLFHFPLWWFKYSPQQFLRLTKNLIIFLDNKLAVSLMARLMFIPLFHDTSFLGRILSLIFRFIRVIIGSIIVVISILALVFWFLVWFISPILLVGYFPQFGWLVLLAFWLFDFYRQLKTSLTITADTQPQPDEIKQYCSQSAQSLLSQSGKDSQKLLSLLLADNQVNNLLQRLEIINKTISKIRPPFIISDWLNSAFIEAQKLKSPYLTSLHLLLVILKQEQFHYRKALDTIKWLQNQQYWQKTLFFWDKDYHLRPMGGINRGWTGVPTPVLDKYSQDLTLQAHKNQLPEIIAKKDQLDQLIKILSRKRQNNAVIIGQPGCGKTTLIKGLAQEIIRGVQAESLKFKRLVNLDASKLAAGADSAELNQRLMKIIEEISRSQNIILFVDEVHNLAFINQDQPETSDVFIALEPHLSQGEFQFIGATSTVNFKKYIEPNQSFARLFETIELPPATPQQTWHILSYIAWKLEKSEQVIITTTAITTIIDLADQLIHDRVFPDKAVNLLDEVVADAVAKKETLVTSVLARQLISQKTKVPVTQLTKKESQLLLNLEDKLHQQVIGQNQAIKAIADALRRARTGIKNPNKPIASFLFAGPTGVGKTETAKALANQFFGSEKVMIRLDMSEYQNPDTLNRLIGAPPGKTNTREGGQLTEAVRRQPYTLVLLDEIEKAHPNILNIFLQVLDDARLTDASGKTVNFSNTIIIATSNVGTKELMVGIKKKLSVKKLEQQALETIEKHFRPEFLNRFSGLVVFQPLQSQEVEAIVKLKLNRLVQDLQKRNIKISFKPDLIKQLSELSFSQKWGGRHIDRTIQEKIANYIARQILTNKLVKNKPVSFSADILNK